MKAFHFLFLALFVLSFSCQSRQSNSTQNTHQTKPDTSTSPTDTSYILPGETHFQSLRKLTDGGNNAEAYFSFSDTLAVFQSDYAGWNVSCDQIFYTDLRDDDLVQNQPPLISTGRGRTTCSYFLPGDSTIVYASTHLQMDSCPPVPSKEKGYVWPIYPSYDIFIADLQGRILDTLTSHPGYDAEPTVSPDGEKIVFTSIRSGDLELWTMNLDGSNKKQVTDQLGYDGGAFFSPDSKRLVFRASRPESKEARATYRKLLDSNLVKPTAMEVFVVDVDGSNLRQVTDLGQANWAPFFHPSGEKIIFSSNHESRRGYPFHLYLINVDGTGLKPVTNSRTFDAFPMFSFSGDKLLFSSNRANGGGRATNLFLAEWKE
jgi:Tol biopolymer transport system component